METKSSNLENNIKGQTIRDELEKIIIPSSKVFICGHNRPDYDAIGSAAGILSITEQLGRKAHIVVKETGAELDSDIQKIITDLGSKLNIINLEEFDKLVNDNSILIATDTNKINRNPLKNRLDKFKKILIIDHHDIKEDEIIPDATRLIYPEASSACELVSLALLANKKDRKKKEFKINKDIATLLYAGIELDTNRFYSKTTTNLTHAVADKLLENGADKEYINRLFRVDRATYNDIANLIINGTIIKQYTKDFKELGISYTLNREFPSTIYTQELLAQVAVQQVSFKDTDASFVMGYIKPGKVKICSRSSNDAVNVGKILEGFHGGGGASSAAADYYSDNILEDDHKLMDIVEEFLSLEETPVIELEPDLTPEPRNFRRIKVKRKKK